MDKLPPIISDEEIHQKLGLAYYVLNGKPVPPWMLEALKKGLRE